MQRRLPIVFLTSFVALPSGGCGQASRVGETRDDDGSRAGSSGALSEERVTWDQDGRIDRRWGIAGGWYAYSDCESDGDSPPSPLPCTKLDAALIGPDGKYGWSTSAREVCMKGTVPRVELGPDMTLAYDLQWGAGMGLDLGEWNPDVNASDPYDATVHGIIGFMLDITVATPEEPAPPTLRISIAVPLKDAESHFITIMPPSLGQRVMFTEVEQGFWVMTPTALTPQAIKGIKFDVASNNQAPKDYDFCVSNFRVLCDGRCIP